MVSYIKRIKRNENKERMQRKINFGVNNTDADIIDTIYQQVSQALDAGVARNLIAEPDSIINLIHNSDKHELNCFYALHAIVLALIGDDCSDVLNGMSDCDINTLKKCISIAQKRPCPNKNIIEKSLMERSMGFIESPALINDSMLQSAQITLNVCDLWDESVAELNKWSDAVNNFERPEPVVERKTESAEAAQPENKPELWDMSKMAQVLGYKTTDSFNRTRMAFLKKHPEYAEKFKLWFVGYGRGKGPLMFKAEYFDEFQSVLAPYRARQGNKKVLSPVVVADKVSEKTQNAKPIKQPKTLSDLKAFETYISELQELCDNAIKAVKKAESDYTTAMQKANVAEPAKRRELLESALKANDIVAERQAAVDEFKARLDNANKLLRDRQRAMEALNSVDAEIAKVLKEFKQNQQ